MLKLNSNLKIRAAKFFSTALNCACNNEAQIPGIKFENLRFIKGLLFRADTDVRRAEQDFVSECAKLLGPKLGHEKEISDLAWEVIWQSIAGSTPTTDITEITKRFVNALRNHSVIQFNYVLPNYVICFQEQTNRISVGPVEAVLTRQILPEIPKSKSSRWLVTIGEEPGMFLSPSSIVFQLSPVVWRVKVHAAQGNAEEEALWLINIALSLLRLSYPRKPYDFFPSIGDREAVPHVKPETGKYGLAVTAEGVSGGGWSLPHLYSIDDELVVRLNTQEFTNRAGLIFNPGDKMLAKRFSQGLGWLTRGRQATDRAERFLFFFTAIEALLSAEDKSAPVVQTIARHASVILANDNAERVNIAQQIKNLYAVRSSLVHAGLRNVSHREVNTAQFIAEALYKQVLENAKMDLLFSDFWISLSKASYGLRWPLEATT